MLLSKPPAVIERMGLVPTFQSKSQRKILEIVDTTIDEEKKLCSKVVFEIFMIDFG